MSASLADVIEGMPTADIAALIAQERAREQADREQIAAMIEDGDAYSAARFAVTVGLADEVPPLVFAQWEVGHLAGAALESAIYASWVVNKSPLRSIGERKWLRMFKAVGFFSVSATVKVDGSEVSPAFVHVTERPTEQITVWRGAALSTDGRGMSWSVHREVAETFAEAEAGFGIDAGVWRATVPGSAVLAMFGDERETEVVVNPNMLRGRILREPKCLRRR